MNKAINVKVISVDLGGTLVDVRQSLEPIWRNFLGNAYSNDAVRTHWERATEILREKLLEAAKGDTPFKNLRRIFEEALAGFFIEIRQDFDARSGAEIWMRGHDLGNVYPDAKPFLVATGQKYPICLSSECDLEMIDNITQLYDFDKVFCSEKLKCYKLNPQFWSQVIQYYRLPPDQIIHIGDATSDIIGPAEKGILTCWINRHGRKWDHDVKPDFEVTSLSQIVEILGLK
jgi:putative hydrolase of the HAD superfamily